MAQDSRSAGGQPRIASPAPREKEKDGASEPLLQKPVAEAYKAPPAKMDMRGPSAAVVVVGGFVLWTAISEPAKPGAALPWTLNPTGYLSYEWYIGLYLISVFAKEIANSFLMWFGRVVLRLERMDEGEGKVRKLEVLEAVDLSYLALNTTVEFIGMNHIVALLCQGAMPHRISELTVVNGPLAFVAIMILNDIIYYPFHLVAHKRQFYPYCHKQHHRQFVPFRGYADAANQHPLEQGYGFSIFLVSVHALNRVAGVHAGTAWACFISWAVLNICNHLAFDSWIHLPIPYPAYPRDHQMHHRFPQCNYSTLTSMCDRLFGTFKKYRNLGESMAEPKKPVWYETKDILEEENEQEEVALGRPEMCPSWKSVVGLLVVLVVSVLTLECYERGWTMPEPTDAVHFLKCGIVLVNVAVMCAAAEGAGATPVNKTKRMYFPKGKKLNPKFMVEEAVPEGLVRRFGGGKKEFKTKLDAIPAAPTRREG